MGLFDKVKNFASKNPDKVGQGVDKVGDMIDERTGGKHADKIDKAQDMARERLTGDQARPEDGQQPPA